MDADKIPTTIFAGNRFWRGVKWVLLYLFCLGYTALSVSTMESPWDGASGSIDISFEWPGGLIHNLLLPALVYTCAFAVAKHAGKELLREQAAEAASEDSELMNKYQLVFARMPVGDSSIPITRNWAAYFLAPIFIMIYWFFSMLVMSIVLSVMDAPIDDWENVPSGVYLASFYTLVLLAIFQHVGWWRAAYRGHRRRLWPFSRKENS